MSLHKPTVFKGVATAIVTPFRDGSLDLPALDAMIERQINGGVSALVVAGTTGEGSTLSFSELGELVSHAQKSVGGRVPLLVGCGSNCTDRAARLAHIACDAGADALLAVTPYYNKASDRGLFLHYRAICEASTRPVLVYNVPSRTGLSLTLKHYKELSKLERIVGVKEASGDLSLIESTVSECGDDLDVFTGNDDQTVSAMKLGALGVVSVCSNIAPRRMAELCRLCSDRDWKRAASRMQALRPLISDLFREVNPIPVKYLLSRMELCLPEYRLPLTPPSPDSCRHLDLLPVEQWR